MPDLLIELFSEEIPARMQARAREDLARLFAAELAVPTSEVLTKVETKRQDPSTQMATVAAREAWRDAGLEGVELDGDLLGELHGLRVLAVLDLVG